MMGRFLEAQDHRIRLENRFTTNVVSWISFCTAIPTGIPMRMTTISNPTRSRICTFYYRCVCKTFYAPKLSPDACARAMCCAKARDGALSRSQNSRRIASLRRTSGEVTSM